MSYNNLIQLENSDFVKNAPDDAWSASFAKSGQRLDMREWIRSQSRFLPDMKGEISRQIYADPRSIYIDEYEVLDSKYGVVKKYVLFEGRYGKKDHEFARKYVVFLNNPESKADDVTGDNQSNNNDVDSVAVVVKNLRYSYLGNKHYFSTAAASVVAFTYVNDKSAWKAIEDVIISQKDNAVSHVCAGRDPIEHPYGECSDDMQHVDQYLIAIEDKINYQPLTKSEIKPFEIYKKNAATEKLKKQYYITDIKEAVVIDKTVVDDSKQNTPETSTQEAAQQDADEISYKHVEARNINNVGRLYISRDLESPNHETRVFFDKMQPESDPNHYDDQNVGAEDSLITFHGSPLKPLKHNVMDDIDLPHYSGRLKLLAKDMPVPEIDKVRWVDFNGHYIDSVDLSGLFSNVKLKVEKVKCFQFLSFDSPFNDQMCSGNIYYDANHNVIKRNYYDFVNGLYQSVQYNKEGDVTHNSIYHSEDGEVDVPYSEKVFKGVKVPEVVYNEQRNADVFDSSMLDSRCIRWYFDLMEDLGEGKTGEKIALVSIDFRSQNTGNALSLLISIEAKRDIPWGNGYKLNKGETFKIHIDQVNPKLFHQDISFNGNFDEEVFCNNFQSFYEKDIAVYELLPI